MLVCSFYLFSLQDFYHEGILDFVKAFALKLSDLGVFLFLSFFVVVEILMSASISLGGYKPF